MGSNRELEKIKRTKSIDREKCNMEGKKDKMEFKANNNERGSKRKKNMDEEREDTDRREMMNGTKKWKD